MADDADPVIGDIDPDDVFANDGEPDPEQVARRHFELEGGRWDDLTDEQQEARRAIFVALLAWLIREGTVR